MRKLVPLLLFVAALATPAAAEVPAPIAAAEAALAEAWNAAPLGFRKALLVSDAPAYGVYTERADNRLKAGEPAIVYLEPVGYGYAAAGDGYRFGLRFDLAVRDASGRVLVEQPDLAAVELESRSQNREFPVRLTITLSEAVPGDYTLEFVARDIASDKTGTFSIPVSITE